MFETIWNWLSQNYPAMAFLLIFGFAVVLVTKFVVQWRLRLLETEKQSKRIEGQVMPKFGELDRTLGEQGRLINELRKSVAEQGLFIHELSKSVADQGRSILELGKVVREQGKSIRELSKTVHKLSKSVNSIIVYLTSKDPSLNAEMLRGESPLQPTELGYRLLVESGGKKFVDDNVDFLISEIHEYEIKSGLDVENFATAVILRSVFEDSFTVVKDYIYNNPDHTREDGTLARLSLHVMVNIMGVYLRNRYLERYPGIVNRGNAGVNNNP